MFKISRHKNRHGTVKVAHLNWNMSIFMSGDLKHLPIRLRSSTMLIYSISELLNDFRAYLSKHYKEIGQNSHMGIFVLRRICANFDYIQGVPR